MTGFELFFMLSKVCSDGLIPLVVYEECSILVEMLALRIKIEWYRGSYLFGKSLFKKYRPVPAHTYGNLERHPCMYVVAVAC